MSQFTKHYRITYMAIVLLCVVSLTICMLYWENSSLEYSSSSINNINEDVPRLLLLQSEIHGKPIQNPAYLMQQMVKNIQHPNMNKKELSNLNFEKLLKPKPKPKSSNKSKLESENQNKLILSEINENLESPIYSNPLNYEECQNAIINKYNINKNELLNAHSSNIKCKKRNKKWEPYIWSREFVGALTNEQCFKPRTPIRTSQDFFRKKRFSDVNNEVPVFYHIPKCGSSSQAAMTENYFNFSIHWRKGPETNHEIINTACGWSFIRDPIQRFISGYYTINKKMYREFGHTFTPDPNIIADKYHDLTFLPEIGEPMRFKKFMKDFFNNPYKWAIEDPLKHIASQTYFLSNWYGSDINFFGRIEHFAEHWKLLLNNENCGWFHDLYKNNKDIDLNDLQIEHALFHYGTMGKSLYRTSFDRQKEYVAALGMRKMLDNMYEPENKKKYNISENQVLPPAYYFMDEEMYNELVDYYYQDLVCFGYKPSFKKFREHVEKHRNPFDPLPFEKYNIS